MATTIMRWITMMTVCMDLQSNWGRPRNRADADGHIGGRGVLTRSLAAFSISHGRQDGDGGYSNTLR